MTITTVYVLSGSQEYEATSYISVHADRIGAYKKAVELLETRCYRDFDFSVKKEEILGLPEADGGPIDYCTSSGGTSEQDPE